MGQTHPHEGARDEHAWITATAHASLRQPSCRPASVVPLVRSRAVEKEPRGPSLAASSTASPVLNGSDEATGLVRPRLVATQLEWAIFLCSSSPRAGSCAASRLPLPIHQAPQGTAVRTEVEPLQRLRYGEGPPRVTMEMTATLLITRSTGGRAAHGAQRARVLIVNGVYPACLLV